MKNQKSLGQNWLKDRAILDTIADYAVDLPESALDAPVHLAVEIGPGLGTLTSSLFRRFDKVLAIEFDPILAKNLPQSFPGKNLEVVNADILKFDFSQIHEPFVVAGNIPYYITTPIIEKLLRLERQPQKIVLLIQKEVAEKVAGIPGSSSLSLFVDNFASASLGIPVDRTFFTPPPKVDSRVLILDPRPAPQVSEDVLAFIHRAFSNPRKKLSANLAALSSLSKPALESLLVDQLHLSANARPADLTLTNYADLFTLLLAKSAKNS